MMEDATRDHMLQMAIEISSLRAENEKLRAENAGLLKALGYFMARETPTQWLYGRNHAEELARAAMGESDE